MFDYIACGKIIISSDVSVLKEILKEKKMLFLFKILRMFFSWKKEIEKIKNSNTKRFIISQNNLKLSKDYKIKKRAKTFLENLS